MGESERECVMECVCICLCVCVFHILRLIGKAGGTENQLNDKSMLLSSKLGSTYSTTSVSISPYKSSLNTNASSIFQLMASIK